MGYEGVTPVLLNLPGRARTDTVKVVNHPRKLRRALLMGEPACTALNDAYSSRVTVQSWNQSSGGLMNPCTLGESASGDRLNVIGM